jgi:hypothetical protein
MEVLHLNDKHLDQLQFTENTASTSKLKMRILVCAESSVINKLKEDKICAFKMWVYKLIGHMAWKETQTDKTVLEKLRGKQGILKEVKT